MSLRGTRLPPTFLASIACAEEDCNILICVLLYPGSRRLFGSSWAEEAKRIVAQFRATHDLGPEIQHSSRC